MLPKRDGRARGPGARPVANFAAVPHALAGRAGHGCQSARARANAQTPKRTLRNCPRAPNAHRPT
eukprot:4969643-Lingulodinium_polyedra.AAC.1